MKRFVKYQTSAKKSLLKKRSFMKKLNERLSVFWKKETDEWYNKIYSIKEIIDAIKHFRNNKSPGHDGIPAEFFKVIPACWGPVLSHLFTLFMQHAFYPDEWGFVKVTPILGKSS